MLLASIRVLFYFRVLNFPFPLNVPVLFLHLEDTVFVLAHMKAQRRQVVAEEECG